MTTSENYLAFLKKQFLQHKTLAEKAIAQISDEQLFLQINEDSNSIAMIMQHMAGNMQSRFTNFLTEDGEKEWRKRDEEFEATLHTKDELMHAWEAGWKCVFDTLESVSPAQLQETVYIRKEAHTVLEAFNRQLAHYPYHVGQIVFAAKVFKNGGWESLSTPKRVSVETQRQEDRKEH